MATFCIRKENIEKMKTIFRKIDGQNKMETLINMSDEKRIAAFMKQLPEDEAVLLNRELNRAVASERASALKTWVKNNLDEKYREEKIKLGQRSSIRKFIEDKMFPVNKKTEIVPLKDIKEMSDKEFIDLVKKNFNEKDIARVKEGFKKALEIEKKKISEELAKRESEKSLKIAAKQSEKEAMKPIIEQKKKERIQRAVIENYIKSTKKEIKRVSVPLKDILKMKESERKSFLERIMSKEDASKTLEEISKKSTSAIDEDINKNLDKVLSGDMSLKQFDSFLDRKSEEIAAMKEGVSLSTGEAEEIVRLSKEISDAKSKDLSTKENQIEYGMAKLKMNQYIDELEGGGDTTFKDKALSVIGAQRMIQLGVDFGTTLIQGAGTITEKKAWKANWQGLKNMMSKAEDEKMKAAILGHPNYDLAVKSGLRLPLYGSKLFKKEEFAMFNAFKEKSKIPFIGKTAKTANEILGFFERYVSALSQTRFDIFNGMAEQLMKVDGLAGHELEKEMKIIAEKVNLISGSASLGPLEKWSVEANIAMMSARLFATKFRIIFTPAEMARYAYKVSRGTATEADKMAIKKQTRSFLGIIGVSSSLASLFAASGYKVGTDPRSSDFMKAKVGDTKVDLSLGYGSYIKYLAVQATGQTVTADTGILKKIGEVSEEEQKAGIIRAMGSNGDPITRGDISIDFMRYKMSTLVSVFWDYIITDEMPFKGEPTAKKELTERVPPMSLSDIYDVMGDDKTSTLEKGMLSFLGIIGISPSGPLQENFSEKKTKEMKAFVAKYGEEEAQKAGKEYSKIVKERINQLVETESYQKSTDQKKTDAVATLRMKAKKEIFSKYKFTPPKPKRN